MNIPQSLVFYWQLKLTNEEPLRMFEINPGQKLNEYFLNLLLKLY